MLEKELDQIGNFFDTFFNNLKKHLVGQETTLKFLILSLMCEGHVLLEGIPGLGKTLMVKLLAQLLGLEFKRIQFTPDLMPSDILGTEILEERGSEKKFVFKKGPIFANFILADEINRASPKTQSALLEAMEERQVTAFGSTYVLPTPFFVVATQNPIEFEGTYPLPEAQLDRFLCKLLIFPPTEEELVEILDRESSIKALRVDPLFNFSETQRILALAKALINSVLIPEKLKRTIAKLTSALNPASPKSPSSIKKYLRSGPGPRGAISLARLAKALAVSQKRAHVSLDDIIEVFLPALRHRLVLSFEAQAEGILVDDLLTEVTKVK